MSSASLPQPSSSSSTAPSTPLISATSFDALSGKSSEPVWREVNPGDSDTFSSQSNEIADPPLNDHIHKIEEDEQKAAVGFLDSAMDKMMVRQEEEEEKGEEVVEREASNKAEHIHEKILKLRKGKENESKPSGYDDHYHERQKVEDEKNPEEEKEMKEEVLRVEESSISEGKDQGNEKGKASIKSWKLSLSMSRESLNYRMMFGPRWDSVHSFIQENTIFGTF